MRRFRMKQVDVFTDRPLTGNPLAVILEGEGLSSEEMQAIAREMNLSETTFVLPPTKKEVDYKVRIFTPRKEIPFAGHPSIGTAFALVEEGTIAVKEGVTTVRQELGIGVLPIEIERNKDGRYLITMTQGQPKLGEILHDAQEVADALRIPTNQVGYENLPVQVSSTGLNQLMIPVRSSEQMRTLSPNFELLKGFERKLNATGCCVFTLKFDPTVLVHMRFFAPEAGVQEDPATGSAAGALGAYLIAHGIFGSKSPVSFTIEQGIEIQRPSKITVTVQQVQRTPTVVKVSGSAVTVLNGEIVL